MIILVVGNIVAVAFGKKVLFFFSLFYRNSRASDIFHNKLMIKSIAKGISRGQRGLMLRFPWYTPVAT